MYKNVIVISKHYGLYLVHYEHNCIFYFHTDKVVRWNERITINHLPYLIERTHFLKTCLGESSPSWQFASQHLAYVFDSSSSPESHSSIVLSNCMGTNLRIYIYNNKENSILLLLFVERDCKLFKYTPIFRAYFTKKETVFGALGKNMHKDRADRLINCRLFKTSAI